MKPSCKTLLMPLVLAGFGFTAIGPLTAQTFATLHSFSLNDGVNPYAGLISSGTTLYGTTAGGGDLGVGMVFAVNADGTDFRNLHSFTDGSDGAFPHAGLILSGDTLYGTTVMGTDNAGTVFSVHTDGTGFTVIHSFAFPSEAASPLAGLVLSGNTLYGTTTGGGEPNSGAVFAVNTDGTGFRILHSFPGVSPGSIAGFYTNADGAQPNAALVLSGDRLYGTAQNGGLAGNGTVFAVKTTGEGFAVLHSFAEGSGSFPIITNSDGANPSANLSLSDNMLYGTTVDGGIWTKGTVFRVQTDATGFRTLHSFGGLNNFTNTDGANPYAGLMLWGNVLYGTACYGGSSGGGTVFKLNVDGTGFESVYSFTAYNGPNSDGSNPNAGVISSGKILYGTACTGGTSGDGTVFSISLPVVPPQLTIIRSEGNAVFMWPTNYAGFDYTGYNLQSTTNLGSSAVWTTNSLAPGVVNGQNTMTNPFSGTQQFFRLSQ